MHARASNTLRKLLMRIGPTVHGMAFASNRVPHSGLDGEHGHLIAAYGIEIPVRGGSS